ncbi:MAG: hypothetical protein IJA34_05960 [Lachnospiraceae bacterium]|nr:hypothetical protein [Lachnospiraceae bacterium]
MKKEELFEIFENIDEKKVNEAIKKKKSKKIYVISGVLLSCAILFLIFSGIFTRQKEDKNSNKISNNFSLKVYAGDSDKEITSTEVILDTGSIKRLPVKFKIDGTDIETVRFSCKNQEIEFMDWNEKRPEFGSVQNCTICFGEDENDYNGLIFTWYNWKIKSLINDEESNISSLPQEVKEEVIVMQIKYLNGSEETKAIYINVLDNGDVSAKCTNYKITKNDEFVFRKDKQAIPRCIMYSFEGNWEYDDKTDEELQEIIEAEQKLREYYDETGFEVFLTSFKSKKENEITILVIVTKDSVVQENRREVILKYINGVWEVVEENEIIK